MSARAASVPPRSESRQGERLRDRRRRYRRRLSILAGVLALFLIGLALYGLSRESVQISRIDVFGTEAPLEEIARGAMQGSYLGIVPRTSTFFYPERRIRAAILERYGSIATVSLFRNKFDGLTIRVTNRVPIARWCGVTYAPRVASSTEGGECYLFDDSGLLFATSSEVALVNSFDLYHPLRDTAAAVRGQTLPAAALLPGAFSLAREIASLGSPVVAVVVESPQATLVLESGTRILYRLGDEDAAYTALLSGKKSLTLADGSLDYVDLRFDGKMYLKRKEVTPEQP